MTPMKIETEHVTNGLLIHVAGRLDAQAAGGFEAALNTAVESDLPRAVIEMTGVDYINSVCVRSLLQMYKRMREQKRFMEIMGTQPAVRKLLLVVGLDQLLPPSEGPARGIDQIKLRADEFGQTWDTVRQSLRDVFTALRIEPARARQAIDDIVRLGCGGLPEAQIEAELKPLLADLNLAARFAGGRPERVRLIHDQIARYVPAGASVLDLGCGDGLVGASFADGARQVQLADVKDRNRTALPFARYDGRTLPFPDKSFDVALLVTVLHHCDDPAAFLREVMRVTRRRIVAIETVYLSEPHRSFNIFFDWFYNRVLTDGDAVPYKFNSPEGWWFLFRKQHLAVTGCDDIGLEQAAIPEYHWLYALAVPQPAEK